jgi:cytochrome c556
VRRIAYAVSVVAFLASAASADPIEDRQAFMKQNGRLLGAAATFAKGEKPFDAAEVQAALEAFNEHAQSLDVAVLFPEGSSEGDTRASPKIWEDMAGFQAEVDAYKGTAAAAVEAAPQDVDALRVQVGAIGEACESCHSTYRLPRS